MGAHPAAERDLDPRLAQLIKYKVTRLTQRFGSRVGGANDLRQELSLHVVAGLQRHDPSRGSPRTLADRIVTSRSADLVRRAMAVKRDRQRERPLDVVDDGVLLGGDDRSLERLELEADVAQVLAGLTKDLRWVAGLLMRSTEAEVIRETGLSREQVRRMRRAIAERFRAAGFGPDSP